MDRAERRQMPEQVPRADLVAPVGRIGDAVGEEEDLRHQPSPRAISGPSRLASQSGSFCQAATLQPVFRIERIHAAHLAVHGIDQRGLGEAPDPLARPGAGADLRAAEIGAGAAAHDRSAHHLVIDEVVGAPLPRLPGAAAPEGLADALPVEGEQGGERAIVLPDRDHVRLVAERVERRGEQAAREDRRAEIADALGIDAEMRVAMPFVGAGGGGQAELEPLAGLGALAARDRFEQGRLVRRQVAVEIGVDALADRPALGDRAAAQLDARIAERARPLRPAPRRPRPECRRRCRSPPRRARCRTRASGSR